MKRILACALTALTMVTLAGCDASQAERNQTWENRQSINEAIPVPNVDFSMRRWILAAFYKLNAQPRLPTCTIITSRGGNVSELAMVPTFGMSVNLSNQMTDPSMSEPDSIFSGPNDMSVGVLRNGGGFAAEADTTSVFGDCPDDITKPDTFLQRVLDAEGAKKTPSVQLLPTDAEVRAAKKKAPAS